MKIFKEYDFHDAVVQYTGADVVINTVTHLTGSAAKVVTTNGVFVIEQFTANEDGSGDIYSKIYEYASSDLV